MKSVFLFSSQRLAESAEDADLYHEFNASLKVSGHKAPDCLFHSTFNHTKFTVFSLSTTTPWQSTLWTRTGTAWSWVETSLWRRTNTSTTSLSTHSRATSRFPPMSTTKVGSHGNRCAHDSGVTQHLLIRSHHPERHLQHRGAKWRLYQ